MYPINTLYTLKFKQCCYVKYLNKNTSKRTNTGTCQYASPQPSSACCEPVSVKLYEPQPPLLKLQAALP